MARFGRWNVSMRKDVSTAAVVSRTVTLVLVLYVGAIVIGKIATVINLTQYPLFNDGFSLLGITAGANGLGTVSSSSLIGVLGIIGAASLVLQFVKVKMR